MQLEQFIVGGISTGAGVALHLALNSPERVTHLIFVATCLGGPATGTAIQEAFQQIYTILQDDTLPLRRRPIEKLKIYQQMDQLAHYAGDTLLGQFDYYLCKETSEKTGAYS